MKGLLDMWEFLKTLFGQFVAAGILMGTMLLLFTHLRFDYAVYLFLALIVGFLVFVYWPRKQK